MGAVLADLRPVHVVGIGLHRYQQASDTTFVTLGLTAVRAALADARVEWPAVEAAYTGTALLGFAVGPTMLRYLGTTGIPMVQVENASASGSTAFRVACIDVASGTSDVAIAIGVDKPDIPHLTSIKTGVRDLAVSRMTPVAHFALLAAEYMHRHRVTPEQLALVAVKNHRNGSLNPFAHRQKERTLDDVLGEPALAGVLTRLQCCPIGEGAAAVVVASDSAIDRLGMDRTRSVHVLSSVLNSEHLCSGAANWDAELTRDTSRRALAEAGVTARDLDVIEVHDAFSIEEPLYLEAMGACKEGEAAALLSDGAWDIGGRCAVSPSGGLLSMGHPIGPTGVGQVAEVTRQLRGEAAARQQPGARTGLAHMVGLGAVCAVHVLQRDE